jgi:hypothetical protein
MCLEYDEYAGLRHCHTCHATLEKMMLATLKVGSLDSLHNSDRNYPRILDSLHVHFVKSDRALIDLVVVVVVVVMLAPIGSLESL